VTHLVFTQISSFYKEPPGENEGPPSDMNLFGVIYVCLCFYDMFGSIANFGAFT